jgi:hypothetical protein
MAFGWQTNCEGSNKERKRLLGEIMIENTFENFVEVIFYVREAVLL